MRSEDGTFGYIEAGLPNITGDLRSVFRGNIVLSGLFEGTNKTNNSGVPGGSGSGYDDINFDASRSEPIYGNSNTVQPPSVKVRVKTRYR